MIVQMMLENVMGHHAFKETNVKGNTAFIMYATLFLIELGTVIVIITLARHVKIQVLTVNVGLTNNVVILEFAKLFAEMEFVKQVNKEYAKPIVIGVVTALAKVARVVHHVAWIVEMVYVIRVNVLLVVTRTVQSLNVKMEYVNLRKEKIV